MYDYSKCKQIIIKTKIGDISFPVVPAKDMKNNFVWQIAKIDHHKFIFEVTLHFNDSIGGYIVDSKIYRKKFAGTLEIIRHTNILQWTVSDARYEFSRLINLDSDFVNEFMKCGFKKRVAALKDFFDIEGQLDMSHVECDKTTLPPYSFRCLTDVAEKIRTVKRSHVEFAANNMNFGLTSLKILHFRNNRLSSGEKFSIKQNLEKEYQNVNKVPEKYMCNIVFEETD